MWLFNWLFRGKKESEKLRHRKELFFCAFKGMGTCSWEKDMLELFWELPVVWADNPRIIELWTNHLVRRVDSCTQLFHHNNPFLVPIEGENGKTVFRELMIEIKKELKEEGIQ